MIIGKKAGYIFGFLVFNLAVFLSLKFTKRLPEGWTYLHAMAITIPVTFLGEGLKRILK